jgi:hypothetical protein
VVSLHKMCDGIRCRQGEREGVDITKQQRGAREENKAGWQRVGASRLQHPQACERGCRRGGDAGARGRRKTKGTRGVCAHQVQAAHRRGRSSGKRECTVQCRAFKELKSPCSCR